MFKRSIKLFLLTCIIGLSSLINVNADTLYDKISPGDVIIGNTVFKGNTWISANRAAEAGSLYTLNTGEINRNTYLYDDLEDWYKYNNDTEKYELLSSLEVSEIQDIIHIYYENNKPLINTYESYVEYEYDEEYDENYILDANDVYLFYNEMYGEIFLEDETDENVKLDYENETITCPYHYVFDFKVVANDEAENFKGICGINDFEYVYEEEYNLEEISIESIELTSKSDYPNLLNQDKVDFSDGYIEVLDELEVVSYEGNNEYYPIAFEGKYIAFDITFSENNNVYYYSLMERYVLSNGENYYTEYIDDTTLRLFLPVDSYGNSSYSFLLIDNMFNKYETLYIYSNGLERPSYDFVLENVSKSSYAYDEEMQHNNDSVHSVDIIQDNDSNYDVIRVDTVGELSNSSFNEYPSKWFAVDLFFNEEVDYDYLEITFNGDYDANYDYELLEDRIRFYLTLDDMFNWLPITIEDTRTNNYLHFLIVLNNYSENDFVEVNNGYLGVYTSAENNIIKASINSSNYYDILYDEENLKLYYKNTYNILFMDNDSLKMITTQINNEIEEVIVKEVELMVYFTDGTEDYYWAPSNLNEYTDLYERVTNEINNSEKELKAVIQTFFKPDRELSETEQAEFNKFDALVEAGTVEIVDISSSIYE